MKWRMLAMVAGVCTGLWLGVVSAASAESGRAGAMCEFNVCHEGTGNCQPVLIQWNCSEIGTDGCADCQCGSPLCD